jgi:hypothetical protein
VTGLEILDRVVLGQMVFHRRPDAWDLLDDEGRVSAVLCPRTDFVAVSPCSPRPFPQLSGRGFVPYGERVTERIRADGIEQGIELVRRLAAAEAE